VTNLHSDDRKIKQLVGVVGPVKRGNLSMVIKGTRVTLTNVAVVEGLEMNIVSLGNLIEQLESLHGKDVHIKLTGDGGKIWDNGRCYPVDKVDGVYVISYDDLESMKACREDKTATVENIKAGQENIDVDHTDLTSKSDLMEESEKEIEEIDVKEKEIEEIDVKPLIGSDQPGVDDTDELWDNLDSKDLRDVIEKDNAPALLDYLHSISHWKIWAIKESINRGDLALPSDLMKRVLKIETIRCHHCDEWGKLKKHPKNQPVTQPHNIPLGNQFTADLKGSVYKPDYKGNRVLGVVVAGNGFINITTTKSKDASELENEYRKNLRTWETLSGQKMLSHASDGGSEYTGNDDHPMVKFFSEKGIFHSVGPRDDSKGKAEKSIDSVATLTDVLMSASSAPSNMWSEAAHAAVEILNTQPSQSKAGQGNDVDGAHDGRSHFEMSTGRKPALAKQKKFGCNALVNIPRSRRKKGQRRNEWMVHLRGAPRSGLGWVRRRKRKSAMPPHHCPLNIAPSLPPHFHCPLIGLLLVRRVVVVMVEMPHPTDIPCRPQQIKHIVLLFLWPALKVLVEIRRRLQLSSDAANTLHMCPLNLPLPCTFFDVLHYCLRSVGVKRLQGPHECHAIPQHAEDHCRINFAF
jgi:hypothetical protein